MYACEYGTFLFNNEREREEFNLSQTTLSLWFALVVFLLLVIDILDDIFFFI